MQDEVKAEGADETNVGMITPSYSGRFSDKESSSDHGSSNNSVHSRVTPTIPPDSTDIPLLSLPCDFIKPMLELSSTLEIYKNMLCIVVNQDAINGLNDDTKVLLNPQRLHKWSLSCLREVSSRRYEMQHIAMEFFFGDGSACFVSMR